MVCFNGKQPCFALIINDILLMTDGYYIGFRFWEVFTKMK